MIYQHLVASCRHSLHLFVPCCPYYSSNFVISSHPYSSSILLLIPYDSTLLPILPSFFLSLILCLPHSLSPSFSVSLILHPPRPSLPGGGGSLSDSELSATVKEQLKAWWGEQVDAWDLLRIYRSESGNAFCRSNLKSTLLVQSSLFVEN
jgi:hypothetical protein